MSVSGKGSYDAVLLSRRYADSAKHLQGLMRIYSNKSQLKQTSRGLSITYTHTHSVPTHTLTRSLTRMNKTWPAEIEDKNTHLEGEEWKLFRLMFAGTLNES